MSYHDLPSERDADYRIVELSGRPESIGKTQASYLMPVPAPFRRWPWEQNHDFLRACGAILHDLAPWLWQEVGTFAELVGLRGEQGLFVRAGTLPHGCSMVAWRAPNGHVMVGRTYDFYTRMRTRHLLITEPEAGFRHIGMNGGLVGGRYDGVNEHGLFVGLHKVMTDHPPSSHPGIPYHLIPRIVLESCRTAREAADLIAHIPHLASFNYSLADRSGTMIALECYPQRPVQRREGEHVLAVTNHYTAPSLQSLQGKRPVDGSYRRKAALERIGGAGVPWQITQAAVSNHASGVCSHREFGATLWAGVFDLTGRRVAYSFGAPCRNGLQPFTFPGDPSRWQLTRI